MRKISSKVSIKLRKISANVVQTVESPQGLSGKVCPREFPRVISLGRAGSSRAELRRDFKEQSRAAQSVREQRVQAVKKADCRKWAARPHR